MNNFNESFFINNLHKAYLDKVSLYHVPDKELTRFSWAENKTVTIYAIKVFDDIASDKFYTLYFAVKNNDKKNKLVQMDLINETKNPDFFRIFYGSPRDKLSWLHSHNLLNGVIDSKIIGSSVTFSYRKIENGVNFICDDWARSWVASEYDATRAVEEKPTPVQPFPKNNQKFFIDRYHFDDMLTTLSDSQFTDEFNQCLFAYEHEKWFLCAVGLGSCLEHLMLIILTNYDNNGYRNEKGDGLFRGFPKNPTAKDYVLWFKKDPIAITSREATYINSVFTLRNSVDHHNTGKTQKKSCDFLLNGISSIYNDYYANSILFKPNKSQKF